MIAWPDPSPFSMMRSFQKIDGKKRASEVLKQIVNTQEGDKIFPLKDEGFNLILRRIVRGLSHHHELESEVRDERVVCVPAKYEIPPAFRAQITWHTISEGFFKYGYASVSESGVASFWDLRFSTHIRFYGVVSAE